MKKLCELCKEYEINIKIEEEILSRYNEMCSLWDSINADQLEIEEIKVYMELLEKKEEMDKIILMQLLKLKRIGIDQRFRTEYTTENRKLVAWLENVGRNAEN